MILRPPVSTRTYTLFPYATLFRSQPLAAVYIIAILSAVAVACRPADHLDQLRPLVAEQRVIFGAQRGIARRADDVRLVPRHAALTPACACRGRSSAGPAPAPRRRPAARHRRRHFLARTEGSRVGKECASKGKVRWSPYH